MLRLVKYPKFKLVGLVELIFKSGKLEFKLAEMAVLRLKLDFYLIDIYISQDLELTVWASC